MLLVNIRNTVKAKRTRQANNLNMVKVKLMLQVKHSEHGKGETHAPGKHQLNPVKVKLMLQANIRNNLVKVKHMLQANILNMVNMVKVKLMLQPNNL